MPYDTPEEVAKLAAEDPDWTAYIKEHHLENATDVSHLPGLENVQDIIQGIDLGYTVDVPMRDGYINQLRVHKPKTSQKNSPLFIMIFGGGFIMGDNTQMSLTAGPLDRLYGATVVNVSYRLAPAHKWPTAHNDVWDNLKWIAANYESLGVDPKAGFVLGGGSAGANLAAVTGQKWVQEKLEPALTGLYVTIPLLFTEDILPTEYKELWFSREQNSNAWILTTEAVNQMLAVYAPDFHSADFSPINAPNHSTGLPRTYLSVCGADPLRDDGLVYEKVLRSRGVETRIDVAPGVPHAHAMFPGLKPGTKSNIEAFQGLGWLLGIDKTAKEVSMAVFGEDKTAE